jgi:DNA-binding PadR family transcriptional regulator
MATKRLALSKSIFDFEIRFCMATTESNALAHPDLLSGFIRLHVLHHATDAELTGAWMMEELREHVYGFSAGTLYPMLHAMERKGYLESSCHREGRRSWRAYRVTTTGRAALAEARIRLRVLFRELIDAP